MPTYVYKCDDCEYTFEARQRFSDDPLTECPTCNTGEVRRVIHNVGVVFKGSGFYITDSRNGKNGHVGGVKDESDKKVETAKSDEKKSETVASTGEKKGDGASSKEKASD